jgi:hypothetical protein
MSTTIMVSEDPLTKNDLDIYILDTQGNYINPFMITYTIYRVISDRFYNQECGEEPILETIDSPGIPFGIGMFFAAWKQPIDLTIGPYRIHWNVKRFVDCPIQEEIEEFEIISPAVLSSDYRGTTGRTGPFPHTEYQGGCAEAV